MRKHDEKAHLFYTQYLSTVFNKHGLQSCIVPTPTYQPDTKIRPITSIEVVNEIVR